MLGTIKIVHDRILGWERGRIFFHQDFVDMDSQGSVRIALCELTRDGLIYRLARGIYLFPKFTEGESPKAIIPSPDTIAEALADSELSRIVPYGDIAAKKLGLTSMTISEYRYLTDGAPRKISLSNGRKIWLNHTSEVKIFGYRNDMMQMIASAIRYLGEDKISDWDERILREHLSKVPEKDFQRDIKIPPAWVQDIMFGLRYGKSK